MLYGNAPRCVSALDKGRLETLIERVFDGRALSPPAMMVLHRLRTADLVVEPENVPRDLVTMNSTVRLADPMSNDAWEVTLVYPEEHDPDDDCWSILSPVGAALFGHRIYEPTQVRQLEHGSARWVVADIPFQPEASNWMTL
ncbi:MAG: GreA/GreB family elongation factor [Propionivibrio sp.]